MTQEQLDLKVLLVEPATLVHPVLGVTLDQLETPVHLGLLVFKVIQDQLDPLVLQALEEILELQELLVLLDLLVNQDRWEPVVQRVLKETKARRGIRDRLEVLEIQDLQVHLGREEMSELRVLLVHLELQVPLEFKDRRVLMAQLELLDLLVHLGSKAPQVNNLPHTIHPGKFFFYNNFLYFLFNHDL